MKGKRTAYARGKRNLFFMLRILAHRLPFLARNFHLHILLFDFMYVHKRACFFITYVICNNVLINSSICFKLEINIIQDMSPQIFHFII
jgi:hypothetical protein